jgi:RNA polymerase sigma-70 factor (sigma-E family)
MTDIAEHPLQQLYRDEYRSLVRLAALLIDDVGTCEEIVQDAFANALARWSTVREADKAPAFLRSAVMNGARSKLRRKVVALRHPQAPPPDTESAEGATVDHDEVIRRLRTLPPRQMEALVLRYYLDLPEAEIASTMGVSVGSVKTHVHRGLAALALTIAAEDQTEEHR